MRQWRGAVLFWISTIVLAALLAGCAGISMFDSVESLMQEGRELFAAQKYDEAIGKFEQVIAKDKTQWLAYLYLARCYIGKGSWSAAITNARQAFQLAPNSMDVVNALAQSLFGGGVDALKQGKFSDAITYLVEYIRLKPADAAGYLNAGRAYLGNRGYADALNMLLRGLGLGGGAERQDLVQGLLDGGIASLSGGDARSAIRFLQEYLKFDAANFQAYLNLGKAYWQSGDLLQSLNTFRRALELNPGNEEVQRYLRLLPR